MSKLSICIPTYEYKGKGVEFLSHLFSSIKRQTFEDYNVVVSDHSVDDNIFEFCRDQSEEVEVVYIRNEDGRGLAAANTNSALEFAEGEIIKLIYQDDMFVDDYAFEKIVNAFDTSDANWMMHGFTHTSDGREMHRSCIPQWTDSMLEGRNLLGSPSCFATRNNCKMYMDTELELLIDTDLYHRMRMEHGMPIILSDFLIANREHDNRVSDLNSSLYDAYVEHPSGGWMVNRRELEYVLTKHGQERHYPDETN
tara:strand:+ start:1417 stop:2175 length:759 start_codon:yes stop_codon:yes gene_type:complete